MIKPVKILNICAYSWDIGGPPKIIYDHAVEQIKLGLQLNVEFHIPVMIASVVVAMLVSSPESVPSLYRLSMVGLPTRRFAPEAPTV